VSGVSTLFSEEFYAHTRRYLEADGLLVQWMQAYEIDAGLLSTIFNALGKHYGDYVVYHNMVDLIVVATPGPKAPAAHRRGVLVAGALAGHGLPGFSARATTSRPCAWAAAARWRRSGRWRLSGELRLLPVLDQRAPRARFETRNARELARSAMPRCRRWRSSTGTAARRSTRSAGRS
jgi:hypothetical protein